METEKLKINCLGASNTEIIKSAECETIREVNYPVMLGLMLRCTVRNYGKSGCNIALSDARSDSYLERVGTMDADADVVIFQGEGNDAAHCVPLGEVGSDDRRTFCGAVAGVIDEVRAKYPHAALIVLTAMKKGKPPKKRTDGLTHDDFHRAFVAVCRVKGIEPYDFTLDPEISPERQDMMPDGTHLSEKGCTYYAGIVRRLVAAALEKAAE